MGEGFVGGSPPSDDEVFHVGPFTDHSEETTHAPTLADALDEFLDFGYPHLEPLLGVVARSDAPEEIKVPFLRILGRYLHTLREARIDEGMGVEAAHTCASNAVMGDAKVAALIDRMMNQGVAGIVSRAVE